MKKTCLLLFAVLLTLWASCAAADTATVSFKRLTVPVDAEKIDLGKVTVEEEEDEKFFRFLQSLPNLKRVDMYNSPLIRRRINRYAQQFPEIEFGWTMTFNNHYVRTDDTAFSTRHSNNSTRHTNEDFSILKYCKNLLALDIGHNQVTDLSFLRELPQLKVLILADNSIQDISPIAELKELEYLELFLNNVQDISPLAELTNLVDLNLCDNRISDYSPLYGLTGLRRLWLYKSNGRSAKIKMDETVVAALQSALPDTYIDAVSINTEGGWREGSHYEAIHRIFSQGGQYEPLL